MEWGIVAGALVAGVAIGLLMMRVLRPRGHSGERTGGWPGQRLGGRPGGQTSGQTDGSDPGDLTHGRAKINKQQQDPLAGLGRKSIDSLRVGVVVLDLEDVPVLVNPAARAMGLLRAGPIPGSIAAHPLIRTLAGQVRRTGVRREVELNLPRGREGGMQDSLGVHLRAMGLGTGFIAVEAADVTESHRVARVRRDFVTNVSHELKTPIGALQLLAEALLDATDPGAGATDADRLIATTGTDTNGARPVDRSEDDMAAARRFAERIQHEAIRLGRLVNELLELTRLQGAEPLPAPEPVAVDWVIAEVVDRTRTTAAARRVEVAIEGARDLTVYGSDRQVATAVANLVENAIAYSASGTRVTVATGRDEDHVEIAVTDQGIGIAPTDVDRIFERFYRADQARSRATGGTGLGLAIVKHIATNHGGRVVVSSTLGGGSTFTLRLPARPPDDTPLIPPSAEIETVPAEVRLV